MISYSEYYTRHTFSISNSYILHLIFQQIPALFPQFIFFFAVKQKFTMFKIRRTAILRDENTASVHLLSDRFQTAAVPALPQSILPEKKRHCSRLLRTVSTISRLVTLHSCCETSSRFGSIPAVASVICSSSQAGENRLFQHFRSFPLPDGSFFCGQKLRIQTVAFQRFSSGICNKLFHSFCGVLCPAKKLFSNATAVSCSSSVLFIYPLKVNMPILPGQDSSKKQLCHSKALFKLMPFEPSRNTSSYCAAIT